MPIESYEGRAYHAASREHAALAGRDLGAVYLSLDAETAVAESSEAEAVLVLAARLRRVLALDDPEVQTRWNVSADALCTADYGPCHSLARAARAAGYDAVRSASVKTRGLNLSIWWDARADGSALRYLRTDLR